jgi:predicted Zn-dependent protease
MTSAGSPVRRQPPAHEVVERALAASTAAACMVIVDDGHDVDFRFANNTATTNGVRRRRRVAVVSVHRGPEGSSVGVASRSGDPDLTELVRASEADAAAAPPADDATPLIEPGEAGAAGVGAIGFEEPARTSDPSVLAPVLSALGEELARARGEGHVLSGFAEHRLGTVFLGTSTGLRLRHEQPTGSMELVGRSVDGARSAWVASGTPWFTDVDLHDMHETLRRRLAWAERRVELPPGRYEALLPPDATADLMVSLADAMSGRDAEDGRNAFSAAGGRTTVGERVSPLPFELRSDPAARGIECAPFVATAASGTDVSVFDNGLALDRTAWIAGGVLERLRYHRAAAARSGVPVAPPIDNLVLEVPGAERGLDELLGDMDRGLLLTCLWYIREVDPVTLLLTGLTRDGVYLVERGEVVGAVNNFRFNESPLDLLGRVVEVGRTERALSREWNEWMNRTCMPALRVADFNMSSVSPAN